MTAIENAAPDQASLKAASKLLAPLKWQERVISTDGGLIWGACQGSGANPYRVVVDLSDLGAKCSCPSRKFPCKHALALMLQFNEKAADFSPGPVPDWVTEWLGRRRKTATPAEPKTGGAKSLAAARLPETEKPQDEATLKRHAAASAKRAAATEAVIADGLAEMEGWIADQLRTGLSELLGDLTGRCRRIAARLVDAKAGSLAGRIDGIPARVLELPQKDRADALIAELGKLVTISPSWALSPTPTLRRTIAAAETREALLEDRSALRHDAVWEVLVSRDEARRDGLIARTTWLLALDDGGPRFAQLLDFFPANLGKQGAAFSQGEQFRAEIVFYPAAVPLRAQIVARDPVEAHRPWLGLAASTDLLEEFAGALLHEPWLIELPILLRAGRLATRDDAGWWMGQDMALPLAKPLQDATALGAELHQTAILWDGNRADILAADTHLGRYHLDG